MSFSTNALAIFIEVMGDFFLLLFLFLLSWVREETRSRRAEMRKLVKGFSMTDGWDGQGCVCDVILLHSNRTHAYFLLDFCANKILR